MKSKFKIKVSIIFCICLCVGFVISGCEKAVEKQKELDVNDETIIAKVAASTSMFAQALAGNIDATLSTTTSFISSVVGNDVNAFEQNMRNRLLIQQELLSVHSISNISYVDVSNALAHVSTQEILDTLDGELENLNPRDPKTLMIMILYEVVYRRGEPSWATSYAISKMGDFYSMSPFQDKRWWVIREQLAMPMPSKEASRAEKATYATIQLDLAGRLDGEQALEQIKKIESMVKEEKIVFPKQPIDMLNMFKAWYLIDTGKLDECKALLQQIHKRCQAGELDISVASEMQNDPDATYERMYKSYCKARASGALQRVLETQERYLAIDNDKQTK